MKKTLLLFMTLLTIMITSAQTVGDTFDVDNITYEVTVVGTPNEVRANTGTLAAVVIPTTVSNGGVDYDVTLIKPGGWRDENTATITSLTVVGDTEIGLQAFQGCSNLVTVNAPNVTSRIGNSAFLNCSKLTTVDLSGLTAPIGNNGFKNCTLLTSINIGNATELGTQVFTGCSFTSIDLPAVTKVGNLCFYQCEELVSINMPVVEQLNTGAFNTTGLTSMTFPASLTTMIESNYNMFKNTTSLTNITMLGTPPTLTYDSADGINTIFEPITIQTGTLTVTTSNLSAYQSADVWKDFSTVQGGATLSIDSKEAALGWSFYPNPTNDVLSITNKQVKNATITVHDINGRALLSKTINSVESEINISNLHSGIYLFNVTTDTGAFVKRIVKQ